MFALRPGHGVEDGTGGRSRMAALPGGFVLPRWLRKPVRLLARAISGEVEPPRFAATIMSAALFASAGIYGAALGGHMPVLVQGATARTGFAIEEIRVTGNVETSEIDIFDRVGLDGWTSLVGFDARAARERIESLPWIEAASVRKIYPATLEVKITERAPFAIWQQGTQLSLIEKDGSIIAPLTGSHHRGLPLVVGQGAGERASGFIERMQNHPEIAGRVLGYVRVSDRRWDLHLENGVTIKLPEREPLAALDEIVALDAVHGLLSRDIVSVDMRFGDRMVVRLSPDAAVAREAAMKERLGKAFTPAERRT